MPEEIIEKNPGNSFTRILADFRAGQSLDELSEGLNKLVAAVKETGKGGSISYKLTVKPASKGVGIAVALEDEVTVKLPKEERDSGIFFATPDNNLVRDNPQQQNLNLKVVKEHEAQPLKTLSA